MTIMAMMSCSSQVEMSSCSPQAQDEELTKLYASIDSLHNEYVSVTRGSFLNKWSKRMLVGVADACVSAATTWTTPVGAFICGVVASGLCEDHLDNCIKQGESLDKQKKPKKTAYEMPPAIVLNNDNANFVDSIGYYHNVILNEIKTKGIVGVDENDVFDIDNYINEVLIVCKKYGIVNDVLIDKSVIYPYIETVVRSLAEVEDGNYNMLMSAIFNEKLNNFNLSNEYTLQLHDICNKIIYNDLCVEDDEIIDYGTKINDLIIDSKISEESKANLQIANNVAVNSSLYWSVKY